MAKDQEDGISILSGLRGYQASKVTEGEGRVVVEVKSEQEKPACSHCGSTKLYRHSSGKRRRILHGWSNGKGVYLELFRQRWRCRICGRSFNDRLELLRPYSRITKQAEQEALWQLKERSFS